MTVERKEVRPASSKFGFRPITLFTVNITAHPTEIQAMAAP
jgi:hypothetical protein